VAENTGTMVTDFLERLESVVTQKDLQEMFCEASSIPVGEARFFLRQKCQEKATEMGWKELVEPDWGGCF